MSLMMQEERVHWRRSVIFVLLQFLSFLRVSARIRFARFVMTKNVKSLLSELVLLLASFVLGRPSVRRCFLACREASERESEWREVPSAFSLHPLFCTAWLSFPFALYSSQLLSLLQATGLRDR